MEHFFPHAALPLQVDFEDMEDEDDWDCSGGARILGISYSPDREEASYAALISPEGEVVDYVKLSFLLCSRSVDVSFLGFPLVGANLPPVANFERVPLKFTVCLSFEWQETQ